MSAGKATCAITAIALTVVCVSCRTLKPQRADPLSDAVPGSFSGSYESRRNPEQWWLDFESDELTRLVEAALGGNLSLAQAEARLRQAEALARKEGAALVPDLSLTAGAGRTRRESESSPAREEGHGSSESDTTEDYSLGLAAGYEVDLWGRIRSGRRSAARRAEASLEELNTAAISVSGLLAERWLTLVAQKAQLRLLKEQLKANRTFLELQELRQRKGGAVALDVYQQRQIVAATESRIPQAELQIMLLRHQLCVLLGKPPRTALDLSQESLPAPAPLPDPGLPADVLANRPDVQAAFLRLDAADWDVSAARADRLPAIRLTGAMSYKSDEIQTLFDNWLMNLAAALSAPLIDGAGRRAEVDRTRAVADERLARYREVVVNAIREVEDALVRETKQTEYLSALERELAAGRGALEEARARYRKGASDYLPVLTAIVAVQRLERNALEARRALLVNRVGLYRALGGRWGRALRAAGHQELNGTERNQD
jgi:NodT family efflux transporter outer membrane factor (OMF) lipoprotein